MRIHGHAYAAIPDKSPEVHADKWDLDRLRDDESWEDEWAGFTPEQIEKVTYALHARSANPISISTISGF